jgi:hypothetical protein
MCCQVSKQKPQRAEKNASVYVWPYHDVGLLNVRWKDADAQAAGKDDTLEAESLHCDG